MLQAFLVSVSSLGEIKLSLLATVFMCAIDSRNKDDLIFVRKEVCTENIIISGAVYVATN